MNNDANCYALGVYGTYPADSKPDVLVAITLGTGMGLGIVDGGRLFCGANCGAGEMGCLPYGDSIVEDYCSKKFFEGAGWDSKEAYLAAEAGNPDALELFDEFGRHLGAALCAVMYAYDPDRIALAGGVANNYPFFRQAMEEYVRIALAGGVANNYPFFRQAMEEYVNANFPYRKAVERLTIDVRTDGNLPVIGAALL